MWWAGSPSTSPTQQPTRPLGEFVTWTVFRLLLASWQLEKLRPVAASQGREGLTGCKQPQNTLANQHVAFSFGIAREKPRTSPSIVEPDKGRAPSLGFKPRNMVLSASCHATVPNPVRHLCCYQLCLSATLHRLPAPCLSAGHCSAPDGLAHNCSVCWNATTKTQFWGFVNAVINLQSLVDGQDSRLRDLRVMVGTEGGWGLGVWLPF